MLGAKEFSAAVLVTMSLFAAPAVAQDSSIEGYSTDDVTGGDRLGPADGVPLPDNTEGGTETDVGPTDDVAGEEFTGGGRPVDTTEDGPLAPNDTAGVETENAANSGVGGGGGGGDGGGTTTGTAGLPFTGLDLGLIAVAGLMLALLGLGLRRVASSAARPV